MQIKDMLNILAQKARLETESIDNRFIQFKKGNKNFSFIVNGTNIYGCKEEYKSINEYKQFDLYNPDSLNRITMFMND